MNVCICPNCKVLIGNADYEKKCPKCRQPLVGTQVGAAIQHEVYVNGESSYKQDAAHLMGAPFEKLAVSKFEIERAVKWIAVGILAAPLLILFGTWVVANFAGPGVLFFGYGSLLAAPILAFFMISTGAGVILRDPRGKTAQKAFKKIWNDALFDAGAASMTDQSKGSKKTGLVYRSYLRSVHPLHRNVSEQEVAAYVEELRKIAREYFAGDDATLDLSCKNSKGGDFTGEWKNDYRLAFSSEVLSEDSNSAKVKGEISIHFDKTCSVSDKVTYRLPVSVVHFVIAQQYVRCGKYWTPVDPMPVVER